MTNITKTNVEQWSEKGHLYATYLLFFLLPFSNLHPVAVVLWCISWLFARIFSTKKIEQRKQQKKEKKIAVYLFLAFVLLHFGSMFWSGDVLLGLKQVEVKLSIIILTLALLFTAKPSSGISKVPKVYFLGSLFSIIIFLLALVFDYCFSDTLKYQLDVINFDVYINEYMHPAYLTLNLILPFFLYIISVKSYSKFKICLLLAYYFALGLFVYLAESRTGLINFTLCTAIMLIVYGRKYIGNIKTMILMIVLVASLVGVFLTMPKFKNIFDDSEHISLSDPRKILWSTAVDMSKERPLLGYGIGVSKEKFVEACEDTAIYNAQFRKLNVHNQYLEIALESGYLSLLLLLASLYFFAIAASKNRRQVLFAFSVLAVSMFFESMLLRIAGVSTFVALVYYINCLDDEEQDFRQIAHSKLLSCLIFAVIALFSLVLFLKNYSGKLDMDSTNPNTYASKIYSVVENEDLPQGYPAEWTSDVKACKYDSTSQASLWSGNAYMLNNIYPTDLKEGEELSLSVYCYVSPDFDGEWVKASIEREFEESFGSSHYDLDKKGTWQKLELIVNNTTGKMSAYLYFCKHNSNTFKDLKGYVLFAYPQILVENKE